VGIDEGDGTEEETDTLSSTLRMDRVACFMIKRKEYWIGNTKQEVLEDHGAKLRAAKRGDGGSQNPMHIRQTC